MKKYMIGNVQVEAEPAPGLDGSPGYRVHYVDQGKTVWAPADTFEDNANIKPEAGLMTPEEEALGEDVADNDSIVPDDGLVKSEGVDTESE